MGITREDSTKGSISSAKPFVASTKVQARQYRKGALLALPAAAAHSASSSCSSLFSRSSASDDGAGDLVIPASVGHSFPADGEAGGRAVRPHPVAASADLAAAAAGFAAEDPAAAGKPNADPSIHSRAGGRSDREGD